MRGRSSLVLVSCLAAAVAAADEPVEHEESLWDEVARPGRGRAGVLVDRAAGLIDRLPTEAARLLEDAVTLDPRRTRAFYLLGHARYRERSWNRCADALETVQRLDPDYAPPPRTDSVIQPPAVDDMLGLCLALAGRYDAAVAHYRRMLLTPSPGVALDILHGNLADCYLALGRIDEAVAELQAAIALAPRRPILWFALAVAYDRDERVARARDAMLRALELDPQLGDLSSTNTFYVPAEDASYYYGLANQVAAEADPPRRAAAIAHFRHFVALAPPGPWVERARRHLAELGPTVLAARDVTVHPHDEPDAVARLAAALPDLQRCLDGHPQLATRLTVTFAGPTGKDRDKRRAPEPGTAALLNVGAGSAPPEVNGCIEKRIQSVKHAPRRLARLSVVLISRIGHGI